MVRCFIGFLLPDFLKEKVTAVQDRLKELPIVCKPVEKENLHINFSFLGEVEDSKVEVIAKKLDSVCSGLKPIKAVVGGIKLVPNENFIRVIVIEVVSAELQAFAERLRKEIGGDLKPMHITLCRVKKIDNKQFIVNKIKEICVEKTEFYIDSVCLIKSELGKIGPKYTVLKENKL
jgi:2'-5' RNA ligase